MEYITSWERRGIAKGIEQGKEIGLKEGELRLIFRQLNQLIGTLSPATKKQIKNLSLPQLERLSDALLQFSSKDDLLAWLSKQKS